MGRAKRRARPLWTLQRLCFEPDVAADPSDRGENRDPGTATEAIKMHLTVETQLENAPFQARENFRIVVARSRMQSDAAICPAFDAAKIAAGLYGSSRTGSRSP